MSNPGAEALSSRDRTRFHRARRVGTLTALGLLTPSPARAAPLTGPISGWASGVPTYISMYEYVPANKAQNPPILVVSHFCGGSAAAVFGEAQGGGIVAAADKYGFVMIFPQTSNNCWDVGSARSLTHDGGGDTQAVAQMVKYALTEHNANPDRVYAVGTSSGAMMTEALLAVYPELFKAGSEFAGVPAGCWSVNNPGGQWSGPCAGGQVTHTAQQWGDMVRAMSPSYSGFRPRIQLWHGRADDIINFSNQTEAVKEWTNVLGLSTNPTSTAMVTLNNHQWTHESWQDSCGYTVLDAWSEQNGPHGTDANLNAQYVIPFLGLDELGPTDPEIARCGTGGTTGSGGGTGSGGSSSDGGGGGFSGSSGGSSGGTIGSNGGSGGASTGSGEASSSTGGFVGGGTTGFGASAGSALGGAGGFEAGGSAGNPFGVSAGTGGPWPVLPNARVGNNSSADSTSESSGCTCGVIGADQKSRTELPAAMLLGLALSEFARRNRRGRL